MAGVILFLFKDASNDDLWISPDSTSGFLSYTLLTGNWLGFERFGLPSFGEVGTHPKGEAF